MLPSLEEGNFRRTISYENGRLVFVEADLEASTEEEAIEKILLFIKENPPSISSTSSSQGRGGCKVEGCSRTAVSYGFCEGHRHYIGDAMQKCF